jgi:YHS domain-containing protein
MAVVKCLVCGLDVDDGTARCTSEYNGYRHCFDSAECQEKFERNPELYVAKTRESVHRGVRDLSDEDAG